MDGMFIGIRNVNCSYPTLASFIWIYNNVGAKSWLIKIKHTTATGPIPALPHNCKEHNPKMTLEIPQVIPTTLLFSHPSTQATITVPAALLQLLQSLATATAKATTKKSGKSLSTSDHVIRGLVKSNAHLRLPHRNDAKIAKICKLCAFWLVIQLISHLLKIRQKAFCPILHRCKSALHRC